MAIFSSKNKKGGKDASESGKGAGSPPLGAGGFPRSGSGGNIAQQASGLPASHSASSGIPIPASQSLNSSLPASAPSSQTTAPPLAVLYPWSLRPLTLSSSSLLAPPSDSASPSQAARTVEGPISPPPFPRYGHSVNPVASVATGELYIFGGLVQNAVKNDLYILNCSGTATGANGGLDVKLVETRGEIPGQRVGHASVGVGNVLIVWGGDTKSRPEDKQDDGLYLLNLSTREWTLVRTLGPSPEGRYGHAAAMVGSKFFIFGGQKDDGGFMNDLCWFDLQKLKAGAPKWTFVDYPKSAVVPPKRTGHTTVTYGDCIYVFGGTDGLYHYNDTWCYDVPTSTWVELSCIGYIPVPREGHAATLVDDVMYVFGGRGVDGKDLEDLAAFKISNQRWFMFQNMGPAPSGRSGHAMATYQNKVLVLGGESYTSQRADDPGLVSVLDTSKIKYPADTSRQAGQPVSRKSSIPVMGSSGSNTNSPALNGASSPPLNYDADESRLRAASPTGGSNLGQGQTGLGLGQPNSFGQMVGQQNGANRPLVTAAGIVGGAGAAQQASKIAKRATTSSAAPSRPARPDEELHRRTMDPSSTPAVSFDRAISPPSSLPSGIAQRSVSNPAPQRSISPSGSALASPTGSSSRSPAGAAAGVFAGQQQLSRSAGAAGARSPSPNGLGGPFEPQSETHGAHSTSTPPQDAFYYNTRAAGPDSSAALKAKDEEIEQLKRREDWLRAALREARRNGVPGGQSSSVSRATSGQASDDGEKDVKTEDGPAAETAASGAAAANREIMEALLSMKKELAQAKSDMAEQASTVDERISGATRARSAALQEASYYRAKLAAYESGSPSDIGKLERERTTELERKLAEALEGKSALERRAAQLETDLAHHSEMRSATEERHAAASTRADAAESNYARALTDYAELQRRAHGHETALQDHAEKAASLTSGNAQLLAENAQLKEQLEAANASIASHVLTLEQSQLALAAAHTRNDEVHAIWESSQHELTSHQSRAAQLQADLDAKHIESTAATAKAADLERLLKSTREAHQATQLLATGGLATLLAKKEPATTSRAVGEGDAPVPAHAERMRAIEEESATIKQLHQETRSKSEAAMIELNTVRAREAQLQSQVLQLHSEIASLRSQHAQALDDVTKHKAAHSSREAELRDAARAKEAAEVKVGLLRNVMSDHGLTASDDELATRFPPLTGSETPEQLHRRVQELEGHLEQRTKAHRDLEQSHEEAVRLRDEHAQEVERLRNASPVGIPAHLERATKAEEELEALQGRHKQLEGTHLKAVQYVKGTEKMLRRMKEELTRYKERCEELESPNRAPPAEHVAELEGLRNQISTLKSSHDHTRSAHEDLQRQFASVQADHQISQSKTKELTDEISRLDRALEKAHHDLEETLAVNASLNKELTAALKNPTSNRSAVGGDDLSRVEAELTQAQNKAEWLKRENAQLEDRCRTAESKIAILLDHLEGASESHDPSPDHEGNEWRASGNNSDGESEYSARGQSAAHH